jgi:hypothetical protein
VGGPGLDFETWVMRPGPIVRRNPGLKIETWATHLKHWKLGFDFRFCQGKASHW